ncbi:hypothetical protein [Kitasatospora azatica]|uniref:hypothetical protein n=1 Tax=Kitasatospora azatica TaxID=58347 RepID=UPI0012FCFDC3|nr:hypothetical protein [Kitasatospora azatica]
MSVEDVCEAYWRVIDALPEGTEDLVDGTEEELPIAPLLYDRSGEVIAQLVSVEVQEADLALLAAFADAFADALDRAAGLRPGPQHGELRQVLDDLGREGYWLWMPQGDAATVAHWIRNALSLFLHPPFDGPQGEEAHELADRTAAAPRPGERRRARRRGRGPGRRGDAAGWSSGLSAGRT